MICCHEICLHCKPTFTLLRGDGDEVQSTQTLWFFISPSIHPSFGANSIKTQLQAPKQSCRQHTLSLTFSLTLSRSRQSSTWTELAYIFVFSPSICKSSSSHERHQHVTDSGEVNITCLPEKNKLTNQKYKIISSESHILPEATHKTHNRIYQTNCHVCISNDSDQFNFML